MGYYEMKKTDFHTIISLMQSFFYYIIFLKVLFSSLIEKRPCFFILSSAEGFASLAQQVSLSWQEPLLLRAGRRQSFAPPCRLNCFLQGLCSILHTNERAVPHTAKRLFAFGLQLHVRLKSSSPSCWQQCPCLFLQLLNLVQTL